MPGKPKTRVIAIDFAGTLTERHRWNALLDEMRDNGHRICVLTTCSEDDFDELDYEDLERQGIQIGPDVLICRAQKFNADYYDLLAEKLDVFIPDIVLIDDEEVNVCAAQKAGAAGIRFYNKRRQAIAHVREALVACEVLRV